MKKKTIWTIAVIMGLSFILLLFLQLTYIREMANMKKEQFDESVNRALYQASRNLELNETLRYLEKDVRETERKENHQGNGSAGAQKDDADSSSRRTANSFRGSNYLTFRMKMKMDNPVNMPKAMILINDKNSNNAASRSLQEIVKTDTSTRRHWSTRL